MNKYIAVFKTLSYAGRAKNEFAEQNRPETIKTPRSVEGGCSYSLAFNESQLEIMKKIVSRQYRGFLGIYRQTLRGTYESIENLGERK